MKWQLLAMGISWSVFLFKVYQQYRKCRADFHQEGFETSSQKVVKNIVFDSSIERQGNTPEKQIEEEAKKDKSHKHNNQLQLGQNMQEIQQKIIQEGNQASIKEKESSKKDQDDLDETRYDYVVFPQLYPHLRKSKHIKKSSESERKQLQLRKKRELRKHKDWFLTNRVLMEIKDIGVISDSDLKSNYKSLVNDVKVSCLERKSSMMSDDDCKSEMSQIIFVPNRENQKIKIKKEEKLLECLEKEQVFREVEKYDPFV